VAQTERKSAPSPPPYWWLYVQWPDADIVMVEWAVLPEQNDCCDNAFNVLKLFRALDHQFPAWLLFASEKLIQYPKV
jgi:hypothetical protein